MSKKEMSMDEVMEHDWESEHALDTLIKAEEIKANPKMMKKVKKAKERRKKALSKV
jgi:isopentenyldiphosphate isomerase